MTYQRFNDWQTRLQHWLGTSRKWCGLRPVTMIFAPSLLRSFAVARPIPEVPPVMRTTCFISIRSCWGNRFVWVSVSMGQGLGLASISEARASACVSTYSRTFVNLPFRTVMSMTHSSLYGLFVA